MLSKIEQRICIKLCVSNQATATDTYKMLKHCYGDECLSKTQVFQWHKLFKEGRRVTVEDQSRSGRPSTSTNHQHIEDVKELLLSNRRYSVRDLADIVGISVSSCHLIISDTLQMKPVNGRLVPKVLNFMEKQDRVDVCKEMLVEVKNDDTFIKRIITGTETWLYVPYAETLEESQLNEWHKINDETSGKKTRKIRPKIEVMISIFFDIQGIVHYEFLPNGQMPNKEYHLDVMSRLRDAICKNRSELWENNTWILHYDNLLTRTSYIIRDYLTKHSTNQIDQPSYSPDLAPFDYFLFPKLKVSLRGHRFETIDAIKEESIRILTTIPQHEYQKCMKNWIKRWYMCIESEGDYFEGDNNNFSK